VKDLGEPREVSRFLRHKYRAFGSLPFPAGPPPPNVLPAAAVVCDVGNLDDTLMTGAF